MRINYAPAGFEAYGEEEIQAVADSLRDGWLAPGKRVKAFEDEVAKLFGKKYGVMVNSGSSANLLAAEEIDGRVGTPALTFTTTLSYLKNPVLADVEEGTYQIDFSKLGEVDSLFVPKLLGNSPDWSKAPKVKTVVDSCDTVGVVEGDIITTSFYASHLLTCAGGGGMVMTDDEGVYKRLLSKRAWGRTIVDEKDIKGRFQPLDGVIYDSRFKFEHRGHNLQPIELQGAFGLEQLKRLPNNLKSRRKIFKQLYDFFKKYEDRFILPISRDAEWMNFPLTIREGIDRNDLCMYLESKDIQTRPIFSGNITRQPAYNYLRGDFPVADKVMKDGFLLGAHHGMEGKLDYLFSTLEEYLG